MKQQSTESYWTVIICIVALQVKGGYGLNLDSLQSCHLVGILVDSESRLHLYVNGMDQGVAACDIPAVCYAVVDIYGQCEEVEATRALFNWVPCGLPPAVHVPIVPTVRRCLTSRSHHFTIHPYPCIKITLDVGTQNGSICQNDYNDLDYGSLIHKDVSQLVHCVTGQVLHLR
jgi:hypothetical protein